MLTFNLIEINSEINRIALSGRLDAAGASQIELPFTAIVSGGGRHVALDLTEVDFVASLGLRLLLSNARVLQRRERKLVIYGAQPEVMEVFETVALGSLIPVVQTQAEAAAALAG